MLKDRGSSAYYKQNVGSCNDKNPGKQINSLPNRYIGQQADTNITEIDLATVI